MTDRYLKLPICVNRLLNEYKAYGSLVIAYDYDNTVFDYHKHGDTFPQLIRVLQQAKEKGCYMIVFTSCPETEYDNIRAYLNQNDIPFDSINEDAPFVPIKGAKKIYFNHLLDDRAGLSAAYNILQITLSLI